MTWCHPVGRSGEVENWTAGEVNTIRRISAELLSVNTSHPFRDRPMRDLQLVSMLKDQLDHEEHKTEVSAREVRETKHSVVKLLYSELMRDSMQHAEVLNCAVTYLATKQWEALAPLKETREEILRLMDMEEKALRLFTTASGQVGGTHLKSLLTMLAFDEEQHYAMLKYVLENFVEEGIRR